jgi:hypothetical protein
LRLHFVTLAVGAFAAFSGPSAVYAATYYVATTGSDMNAGSEAAPFGSWAKAQSIAMPGDTVYFRAGRYKYSDATSDCGGNTSAGVNAIVLSKSGVPGKPIQYWAYPGERPIFDFSGLTDMGKYNCRQTGLRVTGSYLHLKGLEFTGVLQVNNLNHESWCVYVYGGSHNLFELLDAHHNMGPGFFIQRGGDNTFLNCDSHENEDTLTSNGDGQSADGFGCHPNRAGDTGNVFRGCRAWWNTDDGWDFINATEACTVEHSWSWYNGYKPDAMNAGQPVSLPSGNGNGFKGGGYGLPPSNVPSPIPQHVLRFNLSAFNKSSGFYANHSPNSPIFQNNTAFKNGANFNMTGVGNDGSTTISVGVLRNNVAFGSTATSDANLSGPIDSANNSWDAKPSLMVANADFKSVAFAGPAACPEAYKAGGTVCVPPSDTTSFGGLASARQPDGSLPVLPLLHLAADSQLIDRGVDVGEPFVGKAPDLGAFEFGADETGTGPAAGSGGSTPIGATSGNAGTIAAAGTGGAPVGGASGTLSPASSAGAGIGGSRSNAGDTAAAAGSLGFAGRGAATANGGSGAAIGGSVPPAGGAAETAKGGCSCQVGRRADSRLGLGFVVASGLLALRSHGPRRQRRARARDALGRSAARHCHGRLNDG